MAMNGHSEGHLTTSASDLRADIAWLARKSLNFHTADLRSKQVYSGIDFFICGQWERAVLAGGCFRGDDGTHVLAPPATDPLGAFVSHGTGCEPRHGRAVGSDRADRQGRHQYHGHDDRHPGPRQSPERHLLDHHTDSTNHPQTRQTRARTLAGDWLVTVAEWGSMSLKFRPSRKGGEARRDG